MNQETELVRNDQVWQTEEVARNFLEGVRGAIPLATEQIDCLTRLIKLTQTEVKSFLDLGCGDGILGRTIKYYYPEAQGFFLDFSEAMLTTAKVKSSDLTNCEFIFGDLGAKNWVDLVKNDTKFDVIVSGFAIHHQPDSRKYEIYQEIYDLLKIGGIFLNLEHTASLSKLGENAFDQLFVDALYAFHQQQGSTKTRAEIDTQYYNRADKVANILAPVTTQCEWLRQIGFTDVDCFMKLFEIALFGGLRKT